MQRVNLIDFYRLGNALKSLGRLSSETVFRDVFGELWVAADSVEALLGNEIIRMVYCRTAAERLLASLRLQIDPVLSSEADGEEIKRLFGEQLGSSAYQITSALQVFETTFAAELEKQDTFAVAQKGIYSTGELIERAENLFSAVVREQLPPEAISDIHEAGRCLAFDTPTAAGFHTLRAVESVILRYMAVLSVPPLKESERNWGSYSRKLTEHSGDTKIVATLDQIRTLHRNPTLHPEITLTSDEALALLGVAQSAILGMVADIKKRSTGTP